MIEKMKFLSITGPKTDIDRVVNTYLCKYEIHLENALSELTAVESLSPFMEINPYKEALTTANSFYEELTDTKQISARSMNTEEALNTIRRLQSDYQELSNTRADLESQLAALDESLRVIRPFRNINYNLSSILKFQFIHFRFGRIEKEYYQKFEKIFMRIWTQSLSNVTKMTSISGVYISCRNMKHKRSKPSTLPCISSGFICRILMKGLPNQHSKNSPKNAAM